MNLAQFFWKTLSSNGDRILFERLGASGRIEWKQTRTALLTEASILMAALRHAGIERGDRVALSVGKSDGLAAAHVATLGVGAVVVPLNPALSTAETASVLDQAEPRLAITDGAIAASTPELGEHVRGAWWVASGYDEAVPGPISLSEVLAGHTSGQEPCDSVDDEVALMLFTSGTTGTPKGVGLTHRNVQSNLEALLVDSWEMTENDRLLHVLPPHHLHGLALGLYGTLYTAGNAVLLDRFDAKVVLAALSAHRISVFMGVPTMYHRMTEVPGEFSYSTMRLFTSGSAPLSRETFRRFEDQSGFRIVERYGLTETAINTSNPLNGERRPGTVGPALRGTQVEIFDPKTLDCLEKGRTGEIWVKGPNVFAGYWKNPGATEPAFCKGWFRTGDLGYLSEDGYLTINGRMKELIIVGGTNVTPGEVESVVEPEAGVRECAVGGLPDRDLGEKVGVFIVPLEGQDPVLLEKHLRERLEAELASYKRPRVYCFLEEIPRNTMGKIQRDRLKKLWSEES